MSGNVVVAETLEVDDDLEERCDVGVVMMTSIGEGQYDVDGTDVNGFTTLGFGFGGLKRHVNAVCPTSWQVLHFIVDLHICDLRKNGMKKIFKRIAQKERNK
jgi:hypothetical protein